MHAALVLGSLYGAQGAAAAVLCVRRSMINNGKSTRLVDSTLTGNAFGPFPGNPTVLDLFSERRPHLFNTTCDHSLGPNDLPWGVCSGD
jgi:hypothetical protein